MRWLRGVKAVKRGGCALGISLLAACSHLPLNLPLSNQGTDVESDDPYVAFTSAVTAVSPLADPNLDAISGLQTTLPSVDAASADVQRLPTVTPLDITRNLAVTTSPELLSLNESLYQRFIQAGYSGVMDINAMTASQAIQQFCQQPEQNLLTIGRRMTSTERADCRAQGREPVEFPVARDALLIVVNSEDRFVRGVTLERLRAMLTRESWQAVDPTWPEKPIERGLIGPDSASVALLSTTLFRGDATPLLNASATTFYDYPEPMVQSLNVTSHSLGVVNYSTYQNLGQRFRVVPINGISASLETVESGAYPLSKTSFLYADRQQLQGRSPTSAIVNFYLTYLNDAIADVALLPLTAAQLNQSKTQWLNVVGVDQTTNLSVRP